MDKFDQASQDNKIEKKQVTPTEKYHSRKLYLSKEGCFSEKKTAQNWLRRQFSGQMSRDYDSNIQMEHAAAMAATAYAINSLEESRIPDQKKTKDPFPDNKMYEQNDNKSGKGCFSEKKTAQNWLPRQFSRQRSWDYDSNIQMEHAAAIAATAYAIKSLEESRIPDQKKTKDPFPLLTRLRSDKEDAPTSVQEITSGGPQPQPSFSRLESKKDDADEASGNVEPSLTSVKSKKEPEVSMMEPGEIAMMNSGAPVDEISEIAAVQKTPEKAIGPPKKKTSFADEVLNRSDTTKFKRTTSGRTAKDSSVRRTPNFDHEVSADKPNDRPSTKPKSTSDITEPASSTKRTPTFDYGEVQRSEIEPYAPPSYKPTITSPETKRHSSVKPGADETGADTWEKTEMAKIKERYEKLNETIQSWEEKKKKKARSKLDRSERHLEEKRSKASAKFHSDMESIDQIAGGARAQAGEKRRNDELKVKAKANVIRRTGKAPETCLCF